ncbi:Fungal lipase-like domain [Sesbania bispinosa]|nr:Fungal lipase-like domain [Sesbania bispinosa]
MGRKDEEKKRGHLSRAFKKLGQKIDEKFSRKPAMVPMNLRDTVLTLARTCSFGCSETLGKWHITDLAKALLRLMFKQPFQHFVDETGKLVSGYAHHGMVAGARWIDYDCTPRLLLALKEYPHYKVKVVGHSLGGGTAALLTYMLRAKREFSSTTCVCVTFGPAACMTWELAEAGKHFVTTLINGSDIVPSISASSVHNLLADQMDKNEHGNAVRHSAQRSLLFSPQSDLGNFGTLPNSRADNMAEASRSSKKTRKSILSTQESMLNKDEHDSLSEGSGDDDDSDEEEELISDDDQYITTSTLTEGELCCVLEELEKHDINSDDIHALQVKEKERATAKEITAAESSNAITTLKKQDNHCFYPPGRIMHIVPVHPSDNSNSNIDEHVSLYETPRELYSKLRLSKRMLLDHFTVKYKRMVERVIRQLEKEQQHSHGQ